MKLTAPILALSGFLFSGLSAGAQVNKEKIIQEIIQVEKQFQDDLNTRGVAWAFGHYAAENATIKRGDDSLIHTRKGIENFYSAPNYKNAKAFWKPDHVDISDDGTMAWTYGKYVWNFMEGSTIVKSYQGVFHTVWKKFPDGRWLYVWD